MFDYFVYQKRKFKTCLIKFVAYKCFYTLIT